MKHMPVLHRPKSSHVILLFLFEMFDLKPLEAFVNLRARHVHAVAVPCPVVAIAEELPGKAPTRADAALNAAPHGWKLAGFAEWQRVACVDKIRQRNVNLVERCNQRLQAQASLAGDPRPKILKRLRVRIKSEHAPSAAEELQRVAAFAAPEVDREPDLVCVCTDLSFKQIERPHQRIARRLPGDNLEVPGPVLIFRKVGGLLRDRRPCGQWRAVGGDAHGEL